MSEPVARARAQGPWLAIGQIATRATQFAATVALARLLLPEHFGKVAIAAVAWEVIALFGNTGVAATLVQRRDGIDDLCQAAFWLNLTVAAAIAALSMVVAVCVAAFYGDRDVVPIMGLYAAGFLIGSAGTVNAVLLTREIAFGRLALVDALVAITSAVVSVLLALAGFGFWSLVVHAPAQAVLRVALLGRLHPFRPKLHPRLDLWKEIFGYGRYVLGSDLGTYVCLNGDYMITGKVLGQHALGIYSMAYRIANWPVEAGVWIVARVAFPTFSGLQADPARLADVFTKMLRMVAILAVPAIAILFVTTPDLVALLYGEERWGAAVPLIQILLPFVLCRSIGSPANQVLLATGRARTSFYFGAVVAPVLLFSVALGARFGVTGVAVATSAVLGTAAITMTLVSCRAAGAEISRVVAAIGPGALAGLAALAAAGLAARVAPGLPALMGSDPSGPAARAARLCLAASGGAAAAWFVVRYFYREDYHGLLRNLGQDNAMERWRRLRRGVVTALVLGSKS